MFSDVHITMLKFGEKFFQRYNSITACLCEHRKNKNFADINCVDISHETEKFTNTNYVGILHEIEKYHCHLYQHNAYTRVKKLFDITEYVYFF